MLVSVIWSRKFYVEIASYFINISSIFYDNSSELLLVYCFKSYIFYSINYAYYWSMLTFPIFFKKIASSPAFYATIVKSNPEISIVGVFRSVSCCRDESTIYLSTYSFIFIYMSIWWLSANLNNVDLINSYKLVFGYFARSTIKCV